MCDGVGTVLYSGKVTIIWKDLDFRPSGICYVYWPATLSGRSSTCSFA